MPTDKPSLALEIIKRGMLPILPAFCLIGFVSGVISYRNGLAERRDKLAYQVQVMMGSLEPEWVQGNYSKVARLLQQRASADLVAFFSPDCRLLDASPANMSLSIGDCASAARAFPGGVFTGVVDPTGRIGQVFVLARLHKVKIFTMIALQILAYILTLTFVYFIVFNNFLKNELSAKMKALMTGGAAAPTPLYEEFEPIHRILSDYQDSLAQSKAQEFKLKFEAGLGGLAAQVAHDIRSPLAALEVAAGDATQLPEDKRILIRSAVGRIRDIANSLLEKQRALAAGADSPRAGGNTISSQLLSSLIESLATEKRLQFRSRSRVVIEAWLDAASYGVFARVQPADFKRLLSNLINNAVEAFGDGPGSVRVNLSTSDERVIVSVKDDGKGIPAGILAKLGRPGETHGKVEGTGLGLYHARTFVESWGGSLNIVSEVGKGTTTTVNLPQAPAPTWFVSELELAAGRSIVILDDDASIHQVWQGRFDTLPLSRHDVPILHFFTPEEIRKWVKANGSSAREALYLLDYELTGCAETGLSLAEELGIGDRTILVTSRYEEPAILQNCLRLKTQMIPKGLAGVVPIKISESDAATAADRLDAVLIDDDSLARMTWKLAASRFGKRLGAFTTIAEFLNASPSIDRRTPVYVDAELGDGVNGALESARIRELGFEKIYLATGHPASAFSGLAHLDGVVGKEPPWA